MMISPVISDAWALVSKIENGTATTKDIWHGLALCEEIENAFETGEFEDDLQELTRFLGAETVTRMRYIMERHAK